MKWSALFTLRAQGEITTRPKFSPLELEEEVEEEQAPRVSTLFTEEQGQLIREEVRAEEREPSEVKT
jgi:hypothetical protein